MTGHRIYRHWITRQVPASLAGGLLISFLIAAVPALGENAESGPGYGISATMDLYPGLSATRVMGAAKPVSKEPVLIRAGSVLRVKWKGTSPGIEGPWELCLLDLRGHLLAREVNPRIRTSSGINGEEWLMTMPGPSSGVALVMLSRPGFRFTRLLGPSMR